MAALLQCLRIRAPAAFVRNVVGVHSSLSVAPPTKVKCCTAAGHPRLTAARASPLGGSFVTVEHDHKPFECYISQPQDMKHARGVILIFSDNMGVHSGRHSHICDELAEAGFVAACPDFFGDGAERATAFDPPWNASWFSKTFYVMSRLNWMVKAAKTPSDEIFEKARATLTHCVQAHPHKLSTCGALGFCWGGAPTARLLYEKEAAALPLRLVGGIGFHPSHRGWDASEVSQPLLLAPAGDDPSVVHPGGDLAQPLIERFGSGTVVPFPDMQHGWMTRGPLTEEAIARDYARGMQLTIEWFGEKMPAP